MEYHFTDEIIKNIHLIKDGDTYAVFHVPSSRFYELTGELYGHMELFTAGKAACSGKVREVLDFLDEQPPLKEFGPENGRIIKKLTLLSTRDCNLKCRYCFAVHESRSGNAERHMHLSTYKDSLEFILSRNPERIDTILFFGGEPLLGFREIQEFIPYCMDRIAGAGLNPPKISIITNGTVLNREITDFLNQFDNIALTVSIDGPKEINDAVRISGDGRSVYDRIAENMRFLNDRRRFHLNAEVTLNKRHVLAYERGEASKWIEDISSLGFDSVLVGVVESKDPWLEISGEDETVFRMMYREMAEHLFRRMYDTKPLLSADIMRMLQTLGSEGIIPLSCGAGVSNITIAPDGEILPCYLFYGSRDYRMGNVTVNPADEGLERVSQEFSGHAGKKPRECRNCWMKNICGVWCRGFGYFTRKEVLSVSKPRCWVQEVLTECTITGLIRLKKDPSGFSRFKDAMKPYKKGYQPGVAI